MKACTRACTHTQENGHKQNIHPASEGDCSNLGIVIVSYTHTLKNPDAVKLALLDKTKPRCHRGQNTAEQGLKPDPNPKQVPSP